MTHGLHFLRKCDQIVVLKGKSKHANGRLKRYCSTDGGISEVGTYEELLKAGGAFADFLTEHVKEAVKTRTESETADGAVDVDEMLRELGRCDPVKAQLLQRQISEVKFCNNLPVNQQTTESGQR